MHTTKWEKLACRRRIALIIIFVNTSFLHWHAEFSEVLGILQVHAINTLTFACESYFMHEYARVLHANICNVGFLHDPACFIWKLKKLCFHACVCDMHLFACIILLHLYIIIANISNSLHVSTWYITTLKKFASKRKFVIISRNYTRVSNFGVWLGTKRLETL
jgi:hypothetical protein